MALRNVLGRAANTVGLGPAARRAKFIVGSAVAHGTQLRRSRAYSSALRSGVSLTLAKGDRRPDAVPVVMCLWRRPRRIADIINLLAAQDTDVPLRLVLWNNDPRNDAYYRSVIATAELGALSSIEVYSSRTNIGGIGRFLAMRELTANGYRGPFVMLDDDEDVSPTFIDDLLSAYRPHTIAGWWAFSYERTYYQRAELSAGERATYVGTGGAVCDSALVTSSTFFTAIPRRYLFLEDIWMSTFARWNGWSLVKVDTPVEFVAREEDQHHAIFDLKTEFSELLMAQAPVVDPVTRAGCLSDETPTME